MAEESGEIDQEALASGGLDALPSFTRNVLWARRQFGHFDKKKLWLRLGAKAVLVGLQLSSYCLVV